MKFNSTFVFKGKVHRNKKQRPRGTQAEYDQVVGWGTKKIQGKNWSLWYKYHNIRRKYEWTVINAHKILQYVLKLPEIQV